MAQEEPSAYQCQLPKPCLQYPPQGFKQEHQDPQYEQAKAGSRQHFPAAVVVKQEQLDYLYDSGGQNWLSLSAWARHQWGEQLPGAHPSLLALSFGAAPAHCQEHVLPGYLAVEQGTKTILSFHCIQDKAGTLTVF